MYFNKKTINFSKTKKGSVIVFFIIFAAFFQCNFAYSATVDELKDQIQKVTDIKSQLEKEIAAYEQELKDLGAQSTSLSNTIKSLNATINKNALDIKLTQNSIDSTQLQIEQLSINIGKNVDTINQDTRAIASLLNQVNEYDNTSIMENFLKYKDLSEFWNEEQNIYLIQNQIGEKINETKSTKIVLESNKTKTEKKKKDLLNFKSTLVDRKKLLDITKKEKNQLLADTKNSETTYKKMLADKKALADAFDKELEQFQSQLNISLNVSSFPVARHGILNWPLNIIKITQVFGDTAFSRTTTAYNGNGHNGVDFGAPIGTPARASLDGFVSGTGDTDLVCPGASFGKWVFVQYPNGLSTIYAHLSLIKVSPGDPVYAGEVIGYTGLTGFTTGPHLHYGLYATQGSKIMSYKSKVCKGTYTMPVADLQAYLNPLSYLPSL